jgi:hypothetical protein
MGSFNAIALQLFFRIRRSRKTWKVHENEIGLKLNGTHNFMVYADDVVILGDNINFIKKNTEHVAAAGEVSLM